MEKTDILEREYPDSSKKCPECYTYVSAEAKVCPSCKSRIGKRTTHGMADTPINWKAYIVCALAWLTLIVYVKWAFF
jgi:RNA polymerase subunit RPABC4/transcription elongation factor Spt4